MVQVLRLLRRLPVAEKLTDIAIFINRELLPFLQELRESTAATFEQVTTNTLLGRDTPGTGDVEEISLDDTLEFTGSRVIQRAEITGDVTIPAGSNISTVPALAGILSDIASLEAAEYITYSSNAALANERVLTSGINTTVDLSVANQAKINVDDFPLTGLADQAGETFNGNFTAGLAPPTARAGTSVAGAGLTYAAGGTLAVGAGTGITVSADAVSITLPAIQTQIVTGTLNAHVLPTALQHGDTLIFAPSGATTLNGIDLQNALAVNWPEGFEFVLHNSSAAFDVTIIDESGSAVADDRISTPVNQTIVLGQSCSLVMRRFVTRWGAIERGWPTSSTSITYSGAEIRRAALTGAVEASANSNSTTFSAGASGAGLTGGGTAILAVGAGTGIAVAADTVGLATIGAETFFGNFTAGIAAPTSRAGSSVAGDGLTYTAGGTLAVGAGTGITVAANSVAWTGVPVLEDGVSAGTATSLDFTDTSTIAADVSGAPLGVVQMSLVAASVAPATHLATQAARTVVSNNTLAVASPTAVPHTDLIIRPDLLDCFVGGQASTTLPNSVLGWNFRNIAGTGTLIRNGSSGSDGIYRLGTGAVLNNSSSFTLGDVSTSQVLTPTQFKYTEFRVDLSLLTSTRIQIGFMQNTDTATTGGTACCMFMFDSSVGGFWITTTRTASVSTEKISGTAVNTTLVRLGIATDFSGPTVRFYVNDVLIATHSSSENIPTTDMNVGIRMETLTAASRLVEISRFTAIRRLDGRSIPEV